MRYTPSPVEIPPPERERTAVSVCLMHATLALLKNVLSVAPQTDVGEHVCGVGAGQLGHLQLAHGVGSLGPHLNAVIILLSC